MTMKRSLALTALVVLGVAAFGCGPRAYLHSDQVADDGIGGPDSSVSEGADRKQDAGSSNSVTEENGGNDGSSDGGNSGTGEDETADAGEYETPDAGDVYETPDAGDDGPGIAQVFDGEHQCTAVAYAMQDENADDSIFFKLYSSVNNTVVNRRDTYNVESMAMDPRTGIIYGFSEGHMLVLDEATGIPTMSSGIATDYSGRYTGASFHPYTNELWVSGTDLRTLDTATGTSTIVADVSGSIQALAWHPAGLELYMVVGANGTYSMQKYNRTDSTISMVCALPGKTEGLEFDPDGDLVIGFHKPATGRSLDLFDIPTCSRLYSDKYQFNYNDIESMTFGCEQWDYIQ